MMLAVILNMGPVCSLTCGFTTHAALMAPNTPPAAVPRAPCAVPVEPDREALERPEDGRAAEELRTSGGTDGSRADGAAEAARVFAAAHFRC